MSIMELNRLRSKVFSSDWGQKMLNRLNSKIGKIDWNLKMANRLNSATPVFLLYRTLFGIVLYNFVIFVKKINIYAKKNKSVAAFLRLSSECSCHCSRNLSIMSFFRQTMFNSMSFRVNTTFRFHFISSLIVKKITNKFFIKITLETWKF